ncbi:MAG TPA: SRPBCC family protein [Polyangiaceae bacterium]
MSWERHGGLRAAIAQLAAQIMYGEEVKQYFTAKRLAAKRLLGQTNAKAMRYRPQDLPSNGEIKQALLELVTEIEGSARTRRLFAMRIVALEAMQALSRFTPRLIGSVATGHVRAGSDIDLHVFAYDAADVEMHVRGLGWVHETQRVSIVKHGKVMEFTHVLVPDVFPIELTVYPPSELRNRPRSSTDGKPIVRVRESALRKICEAEHAELWQRYLADGSTPSTAEILAAEDEDEPTALLDIAEDPFEQPLAFEPEPSQDDGEEEDDDEREPRIHRPAGARRGRRDRLRPKEPISTRGLRVYVRAMPSFEHTRSVVVAAQPEALHALVDDFHAWVKWSPWEGLDPDLARTYSGAEKGVGAHYAWAGKKSGEGSMAITGATPQRIDIDLNFVKPFKANNKAVFRFDPEGKATRVSWTMSGNRNVLLAVMGKLFFDGMIGKDFDKGLAKLKALAEA